MYVYICEAVRVWLYSNVSCFNYVYNIKRKKKKQNKNQSIIMSLDTDIDQVSPSSTSSSLRRHFLIVPLFNPERRHSWDNAVSNPSQRNNTAISAITVTTTADSTMRWEFFHLWHIIVGVCRHAFDVWERNEGEGKIREKYRKKKREKEWDERIVNAKFKGKLSVTTFCVCVCVCVRTRSHSCLIVISLLSFTLSIHIYICLHLWRYWRYKAERSIYLFLSYMFLPWHIDNGFLSTVSFSTFNWTSSFSRTYTNWQTC